MPHSTEIPPVQPDSVIEISSSTSESSRPWVKTTILALLFAAIAVIPGLSFVNLLHPSIWQQSLGFCHSLMAMVATLLFIYAGVLGLSIFHKNSGVYRSARRITFAAIFMAILSVLSGLVALTRYNAPVAGAARNYIRAKTPIVQALPLHWHILTSLFVVGISIVSFFCLWTYRLNLFKADKSHTALRETTAQHLLWLLFFGLSNFVAGISLAKIHAL